MDLFFSSPLSFSLSLSLFLSLSLSLSFSLFSRSRFFLLAAVGCCCCSSDFKKEEREPWSENGKKRKVLHAGGNGKRRVLGLFPPVCVPSWHPLSLSLFQLLPFQPPETPFYPVLLKMWIYTWLCWPEGLLRSLCCTGHPHIIFDGVNKWTHVRVILGGSEEYKFRPPSRVIFAKICENRYSQHKKKKKEESIIHHWRFFEERYPQIGITPVIWKKRLRVTDL